MKFYRYSTYRWISNLDGAGAARYGARFNPVGVPVVYTCLNPSLPYLECLAAHLGKDNWPQFFLGRFDFDEVGLQISTFKPQAMPEHWDDPSFHPDVQNWGWDQIKNRDGIVVPSRVNPLDQTCILNPQRSDFLSRITEESVDPLIIDDRILGGE